MSENDKLVIPEYGELQLTSELEAAFKRIKLDGDFWNTLASQTTPDNAVEYREGSKGEQFEYVTEEYCIAQLNRLFPGWSEEACKVEYDAEVRNYRATGYLVIEWMTADGTKKSRRIFGVGGQKVQKSTIDPTDPVQPDDAAKGADTDRFKRCCKRLGIGLDIYAQIVTDELRQVFEDSIREWQYKEDYILPVINTIRKKSKFKTFISMLPTVKQTQAFREILLRIDDKLHRKFWVAFQKQTKDTADKFINDIQQQLKKE